MKAPPLALPKEGLVAAYGSRYLINTQVDQLQSA